MHESTIESKLAAQVELSSEPTVDLTDEEIAALNTDSSPDGVPNSTPELTAAPVLPPAPWRLQQQLQHGSSQVLTWIKHRPWLGLPLLSVFPLLAWNIEQHRPPQPPQSSAPTASLAPVLPGSPSPLHPVPKTAGAATAATPKPSPTPVDLSKLTPEQKEMNRRAKAALLGSAALIDAQVEMHVALATQAPAVAIGSPGAVEVADAAGKTLYKLAAGEIYTAQADSGGVVIGDRELPSAVFLNPLETGVFLLGGRPYRGRLKLVAKDGRLWAVNYVNLRNYLHSVVASEVSPSWNKAALKAQAVAARSYALTYYFRPANPLYHLGNDEYYQVYSGIEREAAETNAAVDETSGEYVSYKGGIVESLYAASDDIVAEAFQGKGMSQLGALNLGNQGYSYETILSSYYPSTAVGKIVQDF